MSTASSDTSAEDPKVPAAKTSKEQEEEEHLYSILNCVLLFLVASGFLLLSRHDHPCVLVIMAIAAGLGLFYIWLGKHRRKTGKWSKKQVSYEHPAHDSAIKLGGELVGGAVILTIGVLVHDVLLVLAIIAGIVILLISPIIIFWPELTRSLALRSRQVLGRNHKPARWIWNKLKKNRS